MGKHHAPEPVTPEHGITAYLRGCRCDVCRASNTERKRAWREGVQLPADDARHGTPNGYTNWRCRCLPCQQAWARYQQARRNSAVGA